MMDFLCKASWFKGDVMEIIETALESGGEPNKSDAFTINGQPGDLYNCSKQGNYSWCFWAKRWHMHVCEMD